MLRVDPHTHSTRSDGTDAPGDVVGLARAAGLDVVGLTDHDTTAGWQEAAERVPGAGVALLRGVELSCSSRGVSAHLLAYLFRPDDMVLTSCMARIRDSRATRARRMVERLSADYPITWEQVLALAPAGGPVGRPHIADALVAAGAFPDRAAAFRAVLLPRSPYFVRHWAPDPVRAVGFVREAGGVPVLAHPRARERGRVLDEDVIADAADAGLFALERDHRAQDGAERAEVDRIARRLGLRVTGASDYHGRGKPNRLGENLTRESVFREIEAQGELPVIRP